MHWHNSSERWGWAGLLFHWLTALIIVGLFSLGLWMVELTYYDAGYRWGPYWHKSIGLLLFAFMLLRLSWRLWSADPEPLPSHARWERLSAKLVHGLLYLLIFAVMISGYLIPTADGRAIEVFNWFAVPALFYGLPNQEDMAGLIHKWLAYALLGLALLHALAALKHHFIDKDRTLKRMLGL